MTVELLVLLALLGATVVLVLVLWVVSRSLRKDSVLRDFALHKEQDIDEGYIGVPADVSKFVCKRGVALTVLRPSGTIKVDGSLLDAVSVQDFIDAGEDILVTKYENTQLYVERFAPGV